MLGAIAAAAAPSLVSGVLGMFGAKKKRKQARSDQKKQFERLRESAERGGFNPLTALQATGGAGFGAGALPSSAPPLASLDFIRDAVKGASDEITGVAAEKRATDRFNRELAELQLEKAKASSENLSPSGPFAPRARSVGNSPATARVPPLAQDGIHERFTASPLSDSQVVVSGLYDDRPQTVDPEINMPATNVVTTPQGDQLVGLSEEAFPSEIFQTVSDGWKVAQFAGHNIWRQWEKTKWDRMVRDSVVVHTNPINNNTYRPRVSPTPAQISDWQYRQNVLKGY